MDQNKDSGHTGCSVCHGFFRYPRLNYVFPSSTCGLQGWFWPQLVHARKGNTVEKCRPSLSSWRPGYNLSVSPTGLLSCRMQCSWCAGHRNWWERWQSSRGCHRPRAQLMLVGSVAFPLHCALYLKCPSFLPSWLPRSLPTSLPFSTPPSFPSSFLPPSFFPKLLFPLFLGCWGLIQGLHAD